jgi:hypothetical protein
MYRGYWKDGKQHGEGEFSSSTISWRKGLWEDGHRVKWLEVIQTKPDENEEISL